MLQKPEVELIAQGKCGDRSAISELFSRHYPSSLRVARRILPWDESQDAVQAAYCAAFQHFDSFRGDASFKTWINRIVVNCCLGQLRAPERRISWVLHGDFQDGSGLDVLASSGPSPEQATWLAEIASACADAISKLPQHLSEVWKLHSLSGVSIQEAATTLGLTLPTAKMRLFRARAKMRLHLRPIRRHPLTPVRSSTAVRSSRTPGYSKELAR
jgi:RNA polymerase sigma-70 factor, ECF subfamily